ncbi:unnamed protein product [Cladocopium goreaui]|uniref:Ubiquitin carboxyl-terminal hydrolase n=1 Tax=Cladocopium goreaui TaxID=2562237 RepID=A0A9P1G454_9DINO|nr:unnamed protein product [Cladocopium goreaui]
MGAIGMNCKRCDNEEDPFSALAVRSKLPTEEKTLLERLEGRWVRKDGQEMGEVIGAQGMLRWSKDPADPLEEEEFYQDHRDELLEMLRGNQAKLQPRSEGGVGLLNQGATCYMNSLLQSLFNIPEFRLAVYQFEYLPELHGDPSRCIPLQLQRLFAELQLSRSSAISTKELTTACGFTGRDAMEQHDVQELCRVLFDALERSSSMLAEVIRDLYSGKVMHYTRCAEERQGRVYESRRPASYMDLQVPIQDCKSLEEALRQLVKPTLLSGDNQWLCEELGEKVDAFIGTTIDTLPKILCLQLLRFIFDVQLMRRKKLSDSLAIPLELDVNCLGHEGSYELSAVCLHSGTAHGGHYHAFIRDLHSGVWKDANDSRVHILGQRQCEALFAAEASGPVLYSSDAYFLLYRKTGMPTPDLQVMVPPRLSRPILAENQRLTLLQRAFELHRRLVEVKIHLPSSAPLLQRRYFSQQLAGLVEEEEEEEVPAVFFSSLDSRPEKILERALKSFAELDRKHLDLQALSSARLWHFDPLRGVAKSLFAGASSGGYGGRVELVLQTQGPEPCAEPHTGELLLLVLWPSGQRLSLQHTTTVPWCKVVKQEDENCKAAASGLTPPETLQPEAAADSSDDELPDIFDSAMPVRPSGPKPSTLADVRSAAAKLWNLPLEATVLVALTGMQAGQEIEGDEVTLQECGLSPDDILCVEQRLDGGWGLPQR